MTDLRFCARQYQHLPLDALRGRWQDAERSGFDALLAAEGRGIVRLLILARDGRSAWVAVPRCWTESICPI
jgi:hypothetical protein